MHIAGGVSLLWHYAADLHVLRTLIAGVAPVMWLPLKSEKLEKVKQKKKPARRGPPSWLVRAAQSGSGPARDDQTAGGLAGCDNCQSGPMLLNNKGKSSQGLVPGKRAGSVRPGSSMGLRYTCVPRLRAAARKEKN